MTKGYCVNYRIISNSFNSTIGDEYNDYVDNRWDAYSLFNDMVKSISKQYEETLDRDSMTIITLYEYNAVDGDNGGCRIVISNVFATSCISWYNRDVFTCYRR